MAAGTNGTSPTRIVNPASQSYNRVAASYQGNFQTWVNHKINRQLAEVQKQRAGERVNDLYLNDAVSHGILELFPMTAVNIGLTPMPSPMTELLGQGAEWEELYQNAVFDWFQLWGLDPRKWCDSTKRLNFYQLQALMIFSWKLHGRAIAQVSYDPDPRRPLWTTITVIDSSRLVTPTDLRTRGDVYDGLQVDQNGAAVMAYILIDPTKGAQSSNCHKIPVVNEATGLQNLLLVYDVRNPGEYAQDSVLGPIIKDLRDASDMFTAATIKTMISHLWTTFVEQELGTTGADLSGTAWADRAIQLEEGTIIRGAPGEKPTEISSDSPSPQFADMVEKQIERIGLSTGHGSENIKRLYNASYSAARAAMSAMEEMNDYLRVTLDAGFNDPVMMHLQHEMAIRGLLPGVSYQQFAEAMFAYTCTKWLPPPRRPIDPYKDAKAYELNIRHGLTSLEEYQATRGRHWRRELRQRAAEKEYIQRLEQERGISLDLSYGQGAEQQQGEVTDTDTEAMAEETKEKD